MSISILYHVLDHCTSYLSIIPKLVYTTTEQFGGMIYTYIQIFGLDELGEKVKPKKFKLNKKYEVLIESERLRRKELANAN